MKIEIDMNAICTKCGRKGAITSIQLDNKKIEGSLCLDCIKYKNKQRIRY